jgi:adenosylcobinamide kinase/adenosylcobinamide-phosphate guanylyltransferase
MRSGKSRYAEARLADAAAVTYVATGALDPDDTEWTLRIGAHRERRPPTWRTLETLDVAGVLRATAAADPPVLVDCINGWLAGTMAGVGCWDDAADAPKLLGEAVDELVDVWTATRASVVAVTNEVGMSLVPTTRSGRWFAEELGSLNARLAAGAHEVWQVTVGIPNRLR